MRTVFEDEKLVVRTNDSGEVFVSNKTRELPPELIIGASEKGLIITAPHCNWCPTELKGLGALSVTHR